MNAFLFYIFLHILLFSLLPLLLHANLLNDNPAAAENSPVNSQIHGKKGMPIPNHQQLLGMDNEGKTLADQIMQQMEKPSSDGQKENPWTKLLKNEGIEENDFYKVLEEMREKEQMIGIVFGGEIHQNGPQMQQFERTIKKELSKENMEEIRKLKAIKENDIEMSQIMVNFLTYTEEIKNTGKVSQAMKEYLLICSEIFAKQLNIPLTKITKKAKLETKILAKLVKIVLEKKRQNDKKKNGQKNKQKNGENDKQKSDEEMLRLLYTAADNINIHGDMANKTDSTKKLKRRRRKRNKMTTTIIFGVIIFVVIVLVCYYMISQRRASVLSTTATPRVISETAVTTEYNNASLTPLNTNDYPPVYAYCKTNGVNGQSIECAVCLTEIEQEENVRQLPKCKHVFHTKCIDPWFQSHSTCPFCRTAILIDNQSNTQSAPSNSGLPADENV